MKIVADDLFAGAGGWEIGAKRLGIHGRGIENMKEARLTRDAAGLETIHDDVWSFAPDAIARGQMASPPCQTFSTAGKGAGRKALNDVLAIIRRNEFIDMDTLRMKAAELGDDRIGLVLTPLHYLVNNPNYRWAAWEQVPTVQPVWDACADKLRSWGWSVWTGRMQAEQYGVPQTRRRSILIASRDHEVGMPAPTHSKFYSRTPAKLDEGVEKWISMAESLGWGLHRRPSPTVTGGGTETGGAEPIAKWDRYTRREDLVRPTHMVGNQRPAGGRSRVDEDGYIARSIDEPAFTQTGNARLNNWKTLPDGTDRFTTEGSEADRSWIDQRPSPTIVGSFHPEVVSAPGYRTTVSRQNQPHSVRVTVQEAGVLQSFPEDHPWRGSKGKQYLQAGNAIPPLLAMHVLAEAAGVNMREDTEETAA